MRHRLFLLALSLATAWTASASCGSASCPIDIHALGRPGVGKFTLDLSLQYIDQDQPRIGTSRAAVGEIHGPHHDEVRTLNRTATATLSYVPSSRVELSVALPYVSRDHFHLGSSHEHGRIVSDHNVVPESWELRGVGDIVLQARTALTPIDPVRHEGLWLITGVKLPTGATTERNHEGEAGELPIQPGSGTTDGIAGLSWEGRLIRESGGLFVGIPYFVGATYQFRTGDIDGYRLGNQLELNAGGAWPLSMQHVDLLMQMNARFRSRDHITGAEAAEAGFTGGTYIYLSPGLRVTVRDLAVYGLVQVPLRQDVRAIQLTSARNYVVGVQTSF